MLAIAMQSEFEYDINIEKVIFMLAIHEIGETVIGDLTQFQISKQEKRKPERVSLICKVLKIRASVQQQQVPYRPHYPHTS